MGARGAGEEPDRDSLPEGVVQRRHRRFGGNPATGRRRDPALLSDRGSQGRPRRLPAKAPPQFFQIQALPVNSANSDANSSYPLSLTRERAGERVTDPLRATPTHWRTRIIRTRGADAGPSASSPVTRLAGANRVTTSPSMRLRTRSAGAGEVRAGARPRRHNLFEHQDA